MRNKYLIRHSWKRGFYLDPAAGNSGGTGDPNNLPSPENNGTPPADGVNQNQQQADFGPFKSADELNKGYKELQATYTKSQESLKQLMEWKNQVEQSLNNGKNKADPHKWFEQFAVDPEAQINAAVAQRIDSIQTQILQGQIEKTLETLRAKYPDFKDHEEEMGKFVKSGAFSSIDRDALESLYFGVKGRREFADKAKAGANRVPGSEVPGGGTVPGNAQFSDEQLKGMTDAQIFAMAAKAR